ncbi:MAG: PEP-CTERM sorting domain-containing protein [Rubripirellula sp.]
MRTLLCAIFLGLLAANVAKADMITATLDPVAAGTYTNASATAVLTSQSFGGATFDISYTLGSSATGANSFVSSNATQMGVGSDGDILNHYNTLEGNDNEGISFTGLSIKNFVAGSSGLVVGDITDLTFTGIVFNNNANPPDNVDVSFSSFADLTTSTATLSITNLSSFDVTAVTGYSSPATELFIEPGTDASTNRWAVTGLQVTYNITAVPEASSLCLVGLSSVALLGRRRKRS